MQGSEYDDIKFVWASNNKDKVKPFSLLDVYIKVFYMFVGALSIAPVILYFIN